MGRRAAAPELCASGADPRGPGISVNDAVDYVALGHVTLDRQPDGSALPGGTVLFAALQAAQLGLRAGIVTAGRPADLDAALAPYRGEVAIQLKPTAETPQVTNA